MVMIRRCLICDRDRVMRDKFLLICRECVNDIVVREKKQLKMDKRNKKRRLKSFD